MNTAIQTPIEEKQITNSIVLNLTASKINMQSKLNSTTIDKLIEEYSNSFRDLFIHKIERIDEQFRDENFYTVYFDSLETPNKISELIHLHRQDFHSQIFEHRNVMILEDLNKLILSDFEQGEHSKLTQYFIIVIEIINNLYNS